jgi:RNA polymerase sigma factor (sigma-70 family)
MASDIELLQAWHDSRDAEAFKELTRRYAGLVHAAAKRILGNDAIAEDVTQDSFERLAMTLHPPQGSVAPWLHRVATNRALDRVRADQTRRQREQRYVDERPPPASSVVWEDVYAHVDAAINGLPEKLRMPMIEHFYRGRSAADIARDMGLTRQAVSYRIRKGVDGVRKTLRKHGISTALGSLATLMGGNLAEAAPLSASLTTKLGQLAVAGVIGSNLETVATVGTILGGVLVMKKAVAVVIVVLLGIWMVPKLITPKAEPSPPAYMPRADAPQAASALAKEPEEGAVELAPPTGDITGRFYNIITGEGVPGLRPEIVSVENGAATERVLQVEGSDSDTSGTYQLTGLAPGHYAVLRPNPDAYPRTSWGLRNMDSLFLVVAANSVVRNVDFGLEPGGSVRGVVVSSDGEPVEGAEVRGHPMDTMILRRATSGSDGTFELLMPVYDNTMELQANKDGLFSPVVDSLSFSYEGLKDVVLELTEPRTASVSGLVVDPIGLPVEGVIVTLYGGAFPLDATTLPHRSVKTTSNGVFRIDQLLAGEFSIYLTTAGCEFDPSKSQEVAVLDLSSSETVDGLRFTFTQSVSFSGRVVDTSGQPIKDAYVFTKPVNSVFDKSDGFDATDAEGRFVIAGLEFGEYVVSARARWQRNSVPAGIFPTGTDGIEIVLEGPGRIEGRVVRADTGEALTQFQIYIIEGRVGRVMPRLFHAVHGGSLTYDPEGRFARECSRGEAGDGTIAVVAVSPGFAPNYQNVAMPEDGVATGVEVRLRSSRLIEGRVVNTLGQAVVGARIGWGDVPNGRDTARVVARSDSNGFFSVESIPDGERVVLSAYHPAYAPSTVDVASEVTFVLEEGGMLEGRVWAKGGGPHDVRTMAVMAPGLPYGGPFRSYPGPDGVYRIAGIPPGEVEVRAYRHTNKWVTRNTQIVSGQTTTEDFELEGGGSAVHGQILEESIVPDHVFLELTVSTPEGDQTHRAKGNTDGTYRITGVAPGWAILKAKQYATQRPRGMPWQTQLLEFQIEEGHDVVRDIAFGPGATVTGAFAGFAQGRIGVVTALEGDIDLSSLVTVEDIQAYLPEARAISMGQAVCDPFGQYRIQGLPSGMYTLVAVTSDAADDQDIAQWRWAFTIIGLKEEGEALTVDFDFR